jgi:hypothetical protein
LWVIFALLDPDPDPATQIIYYSSFGWIRDGISQDPEYGINIPVPQHCPSSSEMERQRFDADPDSDPTF